MDRATSNLGGVANLVVLALSSVSTISGVSPGTAMASHYTVHASGNRVLSNAAPARSDEVEDPDALVIAEWTQADIDMLELAAVRGVEYLDLDSSAYEDDQ